MENLFVTYEIAKKLKEKGFNEPTMAYYNEKDEFVFVPYNNEDINLPNKVTKTENENNYSSAPLWQQAIDWLRETQKLHIELQESRCDNDKNKEWWFYIYKQGGRVKYFPDEIGRRLTHNEARQKAIEEALKINIK